MISLKALFRGCIKEANGMRTMAGLAVAAVLALLMAPGVYAADGKAVFRG